MKDKNKIHVIEAHGLEEFEESIHMFNEHLPHTKEIKQIQFQVHGNHFYALVLVGGLDTDKKDKDEKTFNVIGG